MLKKLRAFVGQWRGESIMVATTVFAAIVAVLGLIGQYGDPVVVLLITIGALMVLLLLALLINLKRFYRLRFEQLEVIFKDYKSRLEAAEKILADLFGFSWRENQYFYRRQHFVDEKKMLARILVEETLPEILREICDSNPTMTKLNIFLDSGTTITPIFVNLMHHGLPSAPSTLQIRLFTNNLAGVDEIHKFHTQDCRGFGERDFNLLGGQPLNRYRATTGPFTLDVLGSLWKEQRASGGQIVTLSIITASWLLGNRRLDELQVCARGEGHFQFKVALMENSEYLVVLAPLGKLLRIDNVKDLNDIIDRNYKAFKLPSERRNSIRFLTSLRQQISASPLGFLSSELSGVRERNDSKNFIFAGQLPYFEPADNRLEATLIDVPHPYARDHFYKLYGQHLVLD